MKKNLIALAIAGAFVAPAAAMADGNVTLSGKVGGEVTFVNNTGVAGTNNNTHQVNNNNSVVTLAGSDDLGNGMSAFFSATYQLPLANSVGITGQNQIAGLGGSFGKVFIGAHDNPLKVLGRGVDFFADQSTGDARTLTAIGAVEARANDVIAYVSPAFSGFTVIAAHTNNPVGTVASTSNASAPMNILFLAYANGPVSVGAAWHKVTTTGAGTAKDEKAYRLTAAYTAGGLKVAGSYQKVSAALEIAGVLTNAGTVAGAVNGDDYKVWGLGAGYTMGATTVKGQYYRLKDDSTANNGANMLALGVDYAMSKRTTLQLAYAKVKNDSGVAYGGYSGVGGADTYAVAAGASPSRIGLGMKVTF